MIGTFAAWGRHRWRWIAPLVFLILNLLVFGFYRLRYAGQVETLEDRYVTDQQALEELRVERREIEDFLAEVEATRDGLEELYGTQFATEAERLTEVLKEIRRLARRAGLDPQSFQYAKELQAPVGLVRERISFSIEATYEELRQFVNFLEVSEYFLTLESITLGESRASAATNPRLGIRLVVSTLFTATPDELRAAERSR